MKLRGMKAQEVIVDDPVIRHKHRGDCAFFHTLTCDCGLVQATDASKAYEKGFKDGQLSADIRFQCYGGHTMESIYLSAIEDVARALRGLSYCGRQSFRAMTYDSPPLNADRFIKTICEGTEFARAAWILEKLARPQGPHLTSKEVHHKAVRMLLEMEASGALPPGFR